MVRIGITIGDPNGIGPEVVIKSLSVLSGSAYFEPCIYGSREIIEKACELADFRYRGDIADVAGFGSSDLEPGRVRGKAGRASVSYIEKAVADAIENRIEAVVTAPISKESTHLAGSGFPGHTEMLMHLTGSQSAVMMFEGTGLRVALVTIHEPLSRVPTLITEQKVLDTILTLNNDLKSKFKIESPRIALCGLNPHAGESGAFGEEEIKEIKPAIEKAVSRGIDAQGPFPADTLFHRALSGRWDVVIAMYHDQGLIPFKMLNFDNGVNITLGIPIIRTSPDHGTAFDIAWKGIANPSSMTEAIKLAVTLAGNKS